MESMKEPHIMVAAARELEHTGECRRKTTAGALIKNFFREFVIYSIITGITVGVLYGFAKLCRFAG